MHIAGRIEDRRELTPRERQLLEELLRRSRSTSAEHFAQLSGVSVISRCGCGCPTIDLAVSGHSPAPPSESTTIIADGEARTPEGVLAGVILHTRRGFLSELEVYSMEGVEHSFSLPHPDAVTLYTDYDATPNA
jgi:hypothetical protein